MKLGKQSWNFSTKNQQPNSKTLKLKTFTNGKGLKEIGSMRTGTIFSTTALFRAVFAFVILREPFTVVQALAGMLMVLGVYALYKKNPVVWLRL
ncbi:MAG: DMT family transporter [Candidatus Bathyarchaeota archaeon]|nr:DMT family transporter [Candidatus Bathyarchaeota archaeon]